MFCRAPKNVLGCVMVRCMWKQIATTWDVLALVECAGVSFYVPCSFSTYFEFPWHTPTGCLHLGPLANLPTRRDVIRQSTPHPLGAATASDNLLVLPWCAPPDRGDVTFGGHESTAKIRSFPPKMMVPNARVRQRVGRRGTSIP